MRFTRISGLLLVPVVAAAMLAPVPASAQEEGDEDEAAQMRVVTVTTFQVPPYERSKVFPFMHEYVMPEAQLNPNVLSYRMMWHNWGSDASQVVIMAEYEDISKLEAPCGPPCEEYFEAHPEPEEGDEGWEAYRAGQKAFEKHYAHHKDEIFVYPMEIAKIEGEMQGPVGPSEESMEEDR